MKDENAHKDGQSTILIIDDDRQLTTMVSQIFSLNGYRTVAAHSVNDVQQLLREVASAQRPFDLILLDMVMPQINGDAMYEWLRAQAPIVDTPIIIFSGLASIDKRVELLNRGVDDYLVKTCAKDELLARVAIQIRLNELRLAKREAEARAEIQARHLRAITQIGTIIT